jgi:hypothetical protein
VARPRKGRDDVDPARPARTLEEDEHDSLIAEVCSRKGAAAKCAGCFLALSILLAALFTVSLFIYASYHWRQSCDVPLRYFLVALGVVFGFHTVLLFLQVALPATQVSWWQNMHAAPSSGARAHACNCTPPAFSQSRLQCTMNCAVLPSLAELVLLILGTVWVTSAQNCHVQLLRHTRNFILVAWSVVAFGVLMKIYAKCSPASVGAPTGLKQRT